MAPSFDSPPPRLESESFSRPRPRPPRSSAQSAEIRVQNRRREYLARNPGYFKSSDHELVDPLLHDVLIRRFQTPAEREAEGLAKGYARVLEGSLLRGEERLAKLAAGGSEESPPQAAAEMPPPPRPSSGNGNGARCPPPPPAEAIGIAPELDLAPPPRTKADGLAQWEAFLRERFVRGGDEDFEYARVDEDDEYDVLEREEKEMAWFDEESPGWVDEGDGDGDGGETAVERELRGETGVQDF